MAQLIFHESVYTQFEYDNEKEFEQDVIAHSRYVFGDKSLYLDVKKKISKGDIATIPDGYLMDFLFSNKPRLYIVEMELASHDPFKHIGEQLLKFAVSYKSSGRNIKNFILEEILKDDNKKKFVEKKFKSTGYRNIDNLVESIIFDTPVSAIIVIDEITDDLTNVLKQLSMNTDVIDFQTFVEETDSKNRIHRFTPFQGDIREKITIKPDELDTIVVPARSKGFTDVFLQENSWYSIRISSSMLDKIKYIAAYRVAPISSITHYAEVDRIEKYQNTEKFIVFFKGPSEKIGPIKLVPKGKIKAPQGPRYTTFTKLNTAMNLDDVFL
jgi:hypothetical protein